MSSFYQSSRTKKRKKLPIVITLLAVVAVAGIMYLVVANTEGTWPFAANSASAPASKSNTTTRTDSAITISKLDVITEKKKKIITVDITLNSKEKGHCVLLLTNKAQDITTELDEEKMEKQIKKSTPSASFKHCQGWSVDATDLPSGDYTADVQFISANKTETATGTLTLK